MNLVRLAFYIYVSAYLYETFPTYLQKTNVKAQSSGHLGHQYITFVRACTEQLRQIVLDELYVNNLFEVL